MTELADTLGARVRRMLPPGSAEKRMFGGLGFMLSGNMAIGTTAAGDLLVRVTPQTSEEVLGRPGAYRMMMGERPMSGFVAVRRDVLDDDIVLAEWVARGVAVAQALPAQG